MPRCYLVLVFMVWHAGSERPFELEGTGILDVWLILAVRLLSCLNAFYISTSGTLAAPAFTGAYNTYPVGCQSIPAEACDSWSGTDLFWSWFEYFIHAVARSVTSLSQCAHFLLAVMVPVFLCCCHVNELLFLSCLLIPHSICLNFLLLVLLYNTHLSGRQFLPYTQW